MADATNRIEAANFFRESDQNSRSARPPEKSAREKSQRERPKRERARPAVRLALPEIADAEDAEEHTLDTLA
jgi:hypothetical protein